MQYVADWVLLQACTGTFNLVGVASIKNGPALHTASESGTAFAGPAGPSMPPLGQLFNFR